MKALRLGHIVPKQGEKKSHVIVLLGRQWIATPEMEKVSVLHLLLMGMWERSWFAQKVGSINENVVVGPTSCPSRAPPAHAISPWAPPCRTPPFHGGPSPPLLSIHFNEIYLWDYHVYPLLREEALNQLWTHEKSMYTHGFWRPSHVSCPSPLNKWFYNRVFIVPSYHQIKEFWIFSLYYLWLISTNIS